jgi:hypothetical protein
MPVNSVANGLDCACRSSLRLPTQQFGAERFQPAFSYLLKQGSSEFRQHDSFEAPPMALRR